MDCRNFRSQHLAYLDDTLPGNVMAEAQQHIMSCDRCAAHDTLVRRSLMLAHNHLPDIEPSDAFRIRLQERLATCTTAPVDEDDPFLAAPAPRSLWGNRPVWFTVAAGVAIMGSVSLGGADGRDPEPEMAPVFAAAPLPPQPIMPVISPALVQAMSTGNPMWSLVQLIDEMPAHALAGEDEFEQVSYSR